MLKYSNIFQWLYKPKKKKNNHYFYPFFLSSYWWKMERWIFWVMLNFETQLPRMCTHCVICLSSILFDGQGKLDYIKWHDQRRYKKPHKRKSITRYTIKETSNEYEKVEDDPRQCLANRHPQTHGNRTNFMIFLPCIYFLTGNSRISNKTHGFQYLWSISVQDLKGQWKIRSSVNFGFPI